MDLHYWNPDKTTQDDEFPERCSWKQYVILTFDSHISVAFQHTKPACAIRLTFHGTFYISYHYRKDKDHYAPL